MRSSKKMSQMKHCLRRIKERFNLELCLNDVNHIIAKIQSGDATFIEKQSLRCSLFRVHFNDIELFVVYDKSRKMIATCLTRDMVFERLAFYE